MKALTLPAALIILLLALVTGAVGYVVGAQKDDVHTDKVATIEDMEMPVTEKRKVMRLSSGEIVPLEKLEIVSVRPVLETNTATAVISTNNARVRQVR